jgi:hypothetical protein
MKNKVLAICLALALFYAFCDPCQAQSGNGRTPVLVTPAFTKSLIDSLAQALRKYYIFPDAADMMANYLVQEFQAGAYNEIKDPVLLAEHLFRDLQKAHHDGHLRFNYDPQMANRLADTTGLQERRRVDDSLNLIRARENNFGFSKVEVLSGNIGYVAFSSFMGYVQEASPTFTAAFSFLSNTRALIIDLRKNGGGSPAMVSQVESYFFPVKTHLNDIVDRNSGTRIMWTDPERAGGVILKMPVYILTSHGTFSGAEDFTYGLQSVKRATVVGDTTGGGAHPTGSFNVGMGFVANIPLARSLNPYTHTDWEGTGVVPDIPVPAATALEAAEKAIFTQQLAQPTTESDKKVAQWQLNNLRAHQSSEILDSLNLLPYTGTYQGGLYFYVLGHDLYCRNAERGNQEFKLMHINNNLFQLDENVQVEFTKESTGKFSAITMFWSNGNESYKSILK